MTKEFILRNIQFDHTLFLNFCKFFSGFRGTSVLYSGTGYSASRTSFLALFPYETIWIDKGRLCKESPLLHKQSDQIDQNPWDMLRQALKLSQNNSELPEWLGYLSYEMGMYSDPDNHMVPPPPSFPMAYFHKCAVTLAVDHTTGKGRVKPMEHGLYLLEDEEKEWVQRLSEESKWEDLATHLKFLEDGYPETSPLQLSKPLESYNEYKKKIEIAKDYIRSGDIYQVNLSHQMSMQGKRNPFQVFKNLAKLNPAPFSAFFHLNEMAIVSSSPERFLSKSNDVLETRPIKGTAPRGKSPDEDRQNLDNLLKSPKENAELLMITDLMRHDLGKVSLPGSVRVEQIRASETYENVHHLHSIIQSKPMPNISSLDLIRACFPGGSITGCPKLRAMEIIADIEKRVRGIYTGSIGYFKGNGDFDFNIAIRTLTIQDQQIEIQLGGGIVADSQPEAEYKETLEKGNSIFKVLNFEI